MKRFLIAAFSTGWLFPMWASIHFYDYWMNAFTLGCIWLAAVIFFWAWKQSGPSK